MTCIHEHPDFKRIAISFIMKRKGYIPIIEKNGMTIDDFIEDVRSNIWKYGSSGSAPSTIICNQIKWYIGRINGKHKVKIHQLSSDVKYYNQSNRIDHIDEINKIFNIKSLTEKEIEILKEKYSGLNFSQIGKKIGKSRETVKQIFDSAAKKVKKEYGQVLG